MIVSTELLQTALCFLKRTAGSETEGPVFFMQQACGRLWLSIDQGHISTLVKIPSVGGIKPAFVPLNPIYYFAKNIKSRAIEITGEENITATSLSTQERLTVPATYAGPPERPVFHAAEKTIRTKDLLDPLNLASLPLEEEDVVAVRKGRISGYGQGIITEARTCLHANGLLPYPEARRLVKLLRFLPEGLKYSKGLGSEVRFCTNKASVEIEITVRMDELPSRLPSTSPLRPSFWVETGLFCQMLKRLGLITKGIPSKTMLEFDGLNLSVTAYNSHFTSSFSMGTQPLSFSACSISCRLRPLLSFVSAVRTTRRVYFCISERIWLLWTNPAVMAIMCQK